MLTQGDASLKMKPPSYEEPVLPAHYALLEHEGLLHIVGPDTLTFLQGQTTCDTRAVDTENAVPGAY